MSGVWSQEPPPWQLLVFMRPLMAGDVCSRLSARRLGPWNEQR